jgi:hypothetical protein
MDALLATVQMPTGIPVATVAIDGAKNAALLAIQILSVTDKTLADKLDAAREAGCVLKLFGTALREEKGVAAYVEPTLVPAETPEGNIRGCDNVIAFEGSHIGKTRFVGAGAGRYPTGYAVVQDLVDLDMGLGCLYNEKMDVAEVNNAAARHAYYVRTDFTEDAYFAALEKKALGQGFVTEETSVAEMHEFAARAMAADKEIFIAGFWK